MRTRSNATTVLATCLAVLAIASVLAGPATAVPTDASPTHTYVSQPIETIHDRYGHVVNWAEDVTVSDANLSRNHDGEPVLNVSLPSSGVTSFALLRFPLDAALNLQDRHPLPANVTVKSATLRLYNTCNGGICAGANRALSVVSVGLPWSEATVRWNDTRKDGFFGQVLATSPASDAAAGTRYREWNLTAYYQKLLDPGQPHPPNLGIAIRDLDTTPCTGSCATWFYSSNATDNAGHPYRFCGSTGSDICAPRLTLVVDPNAPTVQRIGIPGVPVNATSHRYVVAPNWSVNLTVNVTDPVGHLRVAALNLTSPNGTVLWTDDLLANATVVSHPANGGLGTRYRLVRTGPLEAPPGSYTWNLHLVDDDGNQVNTTLDRPQVTVEDDAPVILQTVTTPQVLDQGGSVHLAVNVTDPWPLRNVRALVQQPDGTNLTLSLAAPPGAEPYGNGTWTGSMTLATPGTYQVTYLVRDRTGNANVTAAVPVTVRDTEAPTVSSLAILGAPGAGSTGPLQEMGGNLTFLVLATDNAAQPPNVTLRLLDGAGVEHLLTMHDAGDGTWTRNVTFGSGFTPGDCLATLVVRDAAGNRAQDPPRRSFHVEPAAPPAVSATSPQGWGNSTPVLAATVSDLNLEGGSLRLTVSVDGGPAENQSFTSSGGSGLVQLRTSLGPYFVGDNVTVHLHAADIFGRTTDASWSFAVDPFPPRTNVTLGHPQVLTASALEVSRTTSVHVAAVDPRSGVASLEARLVPAGTQEDTVAWTAAPSAFNVTALPTFAGDGRYVLQVRAVDAVGNAETPRSLPLLVDDTPPAVTVERHGTTVQLVVQDAGSGVGSLELRYRNGSHAFQDVPLRNLGGTDHRTTYEGTLPFTARGDPAALEVVATDVLGNARTLGASGGDALHWVEGDHPAVLTIERPAAGSTLSGVVPLQWTVRDPDGDPVRVTVEARPVVLDRWTQVASLPAGTTRYAWDTTHVPDGAYVLRFLADDGQLVAQTNVSVAVGNTPLGLANLSVPEGQLSRGSTVPVEVTIYRPVKTATATLYMVQDGVRHAVANATLVDDGTHGDRVAGDHVFTARFHVDRDGSYTVGLDVLYGDDTHLARANVASFTVASSLTDVLGANLAFVVLGGLVVVGLVAAVVVQLVRYGYLFPKE